MLSSTIEGRYVRLKQESSMSMQRAFEAQDIVVDPEVNLGRCFWEGMSTFGQFYDDEDDKNANHRYIAEAVYQGYPPQIMEEHDV